MCVYLVYKVSVELPAYLLVTYTMFSFTVGNFLKSVLPGSQELMNKYLHFDDFN
jgi:hypothetical protein